MAITKASSDVTSNTTGSGLDVSVLHSLAAGSDRLIVVSVGYEEYQGLANPSCTYGGVSMTLLQEAVTPAKNTDNFCNGSMFFYLFEDDLPSNGSKTVTFTADNGGGSGTCYAAMSVAQYNGVDDTTSPTGDATNSGTSTVTNSISASSGDLVVGVVSFGQGGTGYSHNESQNELLDVVLGGTAIFASTDLIATGSVTAPSSTVTTGSGINRHVRSAAVFSPATAAVVDNTADGTSASGNAGEALVEVVTTEDGTSEPGNAGEAAVSVVTLADGGSEGGSAGEGLSSVSALADGTSEGGTAGEAAVSVVSLADGTSAAGDAGEASVSVVTLADGGSASGSAGDELIDPSFNNDLAPGTSASGNAGEALIQVVTLEDGTSASGSAGEAALSSAILGDGTSASGNAGEGFADGVILEPPQAQSRSGFSRLLSYLYGRKPEDAVPAKKASDSRKNAQAAESEAPAPDPDPLLEYDAPTPHYTSKPGSDSVAALAPLGEEKVQATEPEYDLEDEEEIALLLMAG